MSLATGTIKPRGREETELERYDRNLNELLSELRVALPGVQVLFAFLLVAPFNQRFSKTNALERHLYFAALLLTLFSSILLVAPTVIHRIEFRRGQKHYIVAIANRLTIIGLCALALAMSCAIALVTGYLFGTVTAIVTTAIALGTFGVVWFALPLSTRSRR